MNLIERFHEVMNFNTGVQTMKWEFGYWGKTVDDWYNKGLPRKRYPEIPSAEKILTLTSHLYAPSWNCVDRPTLPQGIAVMAGGLYWPTQGFPLDNDIKEYFDMDLADHGGDGEGVCG